MAWRIHDSVLRGELDNRTHGRLRGRLWIHGIPDPVELDLQGNACADLAGCELRFENPGPTTPLRDSQGLAPVQHGRVGDVTASRKVRVFDVPIEEAMRQLRDGETPPEHLANCLYLEWFSRENGRMVVESADYHLTLSTPDWRLTPEEEEVRQKTAADGWTDFLQALTDAIDREQSKMPEDKDAGQWDEHDYEQYLRESDARTEKLMALFDRYEGHPDSEAIIAREMGWNVSGDDNELLTGPELEPLDPSKVRSPDPATEGVDWVRNDLGVAVHPLYLRCHRAGRAAWDAVDQLSESVQNDPDVSDFLCEFHLTAARLAGALNSLPYGREGAEPGFIIACLKRSLGHVDAAAAAADRIQARTLLPVPILDTARQALAGIRHGTLELIREFRAIRGGQGPAPGSPS